MKTIKTSEATGATLDWLVAAALEKQFSEDRIIKICRVEATTPAWIERENSPGSAPYFHRFSPSTDFAQGGPIIEREHITIVCAEGGYTPSEDDEESGSYSAYWVAEKGLQCASDVYGPQDDNYGSHFQIAEAGIAGPTPLIAAMRCYVADKLGDTVQAPDTF